MFSEKLSKADALILKNLEADIKEVASRPSPANGHAVVRDNGYTETQADGIPPLPPPFPYLRIPASSCGPGRPLC